MPPNYSENMKTARRVTLVGMAVDFLLGVGKIIIGLLASSQAVVADGIHSLSDVITDIFVLIVTRIANSKPDREHPYGHARFETLGTVLLGLVLLLVAAALAYDNISLAIQGAGDATPGWAALVITLASIISKEWLFHYTRKAGEKIRSNLLIANAWHSRTDMFSSLVVLIGVAGAMLGISWLDAVAAVIVALIIGKIGLSLILGSLRELVDTGLSVEETDAIKQEIVSMEGVRSAHNLRTRQMGADIFLDVHIRVGPTISVSEGHQIGEWVTKRLLQRFQSIKDLTYHIDAEDDRDIEIDASEPLLPLRSSVIAELERHWPHLAAMAQDDKHFTLHYLNDKIDIDIFIASDVVLKPAADNLLKKIPWLRRIRVWRQTELD